MTNNKQILAKNVRKIRRGTLDITQAELGEKINKSVAWVSGIETGRFGISGVDLMELAAALGVTAEHLYTEQP